MKEIMRLTYASSLTDMCELNSSFDTGVLRVAYTGKNQNGSFISKESFEKAIKTMYNCPIVCTYDRETDTLGGHDVEIVHNDDGTLTMVMVTTPIGVVPESAKVWWDKVTEDSGVEHEYLCATVLLWKRQEAYQKIHRDGFAKESMEINVFDGKLIDGVYYIYDFEFTAFALIGVEPCFESAALELFSKEQREEFKLQYSEMMRELKDYYSSFGPNTDNNDISKFVQEGGNTTLEENMQAQIENKEADAVFEAEDTSVDAVTENDDTNAIDEVADEATEQEADNTFALNSTIIDEIVRALSMERLTYEWGDVPRYYFVDCDLAANEVYCWDAIDWLLYGFNYSMSGDSVVIDYESKQRKKYAIVDFVDGDQNSPFAETYSLLTGKIHDYAEHQSSYQSAMDERVKELSDELGELRKFKAQVEADKDDADRQAILDTFSDLNGNEEFVELCNRAKEYDLQTLEEKCFAIRGRIGTHAKFALEKHSPRLPVERASDISEEPYGGLFVKYGNK